MEQAVLDRDKQFSLLEQVATHGGIGWEGASQELLDAFGCNDAYEFHRKMWDVYRILRTGRLHKDVTAAMVMLDMSEYTEEQPTKNAGERLDIVKEHIRVLGAQRAWRRGLRDLVDHFDAVVWAVERQP